MRRFFFELDCSSIDTSCASIFVRAPLPLGSLRAFSARMRPSHTSLVALTRLGWSSFILRRIESGVQREKRGSREAGENVSRRFLAAEGLGESIGERKCFKRADIRLVSLHTGLPGQDPSGSFRVFCRSVIEL